MTWLLILGTIIVCAQLWRMGGDGQKWARAVALPALIAVVKFVLVGYWGTPINWIALGYMPALWALLAAFSYGVSAPPHKFWVWVFGGGGAGDKPIVEIFTRGTCGFFWSLAAGVFIIMTGNWIGLICYALFMTFGNAFIGGTVKDVEVSERLVGALVACALLV